MNDIRQKITALIDKKGWTQKEAAKRARVSEATISEVVTGKTNPGMVTIQKFATAFGMSLAELLDYEIGTELKDVEKTIDETDSRIQLIEWALKSENTPYLQLAYNVAKSIPASLLNKLEFTVKINTGGNQNE